MVVPAQQQKCHQDGGSVTKSCPTLLTPWTVARQAPLSMGFSRQEYYSGLPDPGIVPRSPEFMADSSPSHQGSPNLVTKTDFFELASCVSPPMSCWSLSSEHTGSGRPDRLRKEGGAGKRQSRALRRWGSFWVPSAAVAALVAASTQSKLPGHGGQVWDVEMAREARRSLAFLRIQLPPHRAPPRLRGLTPPCVG